MNAYDESGDSMRDKEKQLAAQRRWVKANPERLWNKRYPELRRASGVRAMAKYRAKPGVRARLKVARKALDTDNPSKTRERNRRNALRKKGWSLEEFEETLRLQNGKCWICEGQLVVPTTVGGGPLTACADHDHVTGHRRGLLCASCNFIEGVLARSPLGAERLLARLEEYRKAFK